MIHLARDRLDAQRGRTHIKRVLRPVEGAKPKKPSIAIRTDGRKAKDLRDMRGGRLKM